MFCRQLIWAIGEDGRAYFAQHMSVEDFIGVHPDDIEYPKSTLNELKPHIRNQSPIFRSSFPNQWLTSMADTIAHAPGSGHTQQAPMVNISTGASTVVSAMSAPTANTDQLRQVSIRATTHLIIKAAFAAYIQKFGSVRLI